MKLYDESAKKGPKKPVFLKLAQVGENEVALHLVDEHGKQVKTLFAFRSGQCRAYGSADPGEGFDCDLPFDKDGRLVIT